MEESADALAGVEGALGTMKKQRVSPKKGAGKIQKSPSMDKLAEVAESLLSDSGVSGAGDDENVVRKVSDDSSSGVAVKKGVSKTPVKKTAKTSNSTSLASSADMAVAAAAAAATVDAALPVPDPIAAAAVNETLALAASAAAMSATANTPLASTASTATTTTAKPSSKKTAKTKPTNKKEESDDDENSKKTQIQYNPDIPMTKEQLTAWRREMRRVRNRESAAASRRKVRDRIEELEDEVSDWKKKYEGVMERLKAVEARKKNSGGGKSEE